MVESIMAYPLSASWASHYAFWLQSLTVGKPPGDPAGTGVETDIVEHRATDQQGRDVSHRRPSISTGMATAAATSIPARNGGLRHRWRATGMCMACCGRRQAMCSMWMASRSDAPRQVKRATSGCMRAPGCGRPHAMPSSPLKTAASFQRGSFFRMACSALHGAIVHRLARRAAGQQAMCFLWRFQPSLHQPDRCHELF